MTEKPALPDDLIAEIERLAPQLMAIDHYGVLGLTEASSADEIKAAYLRVTKRFHPDRWAGRESGAHRKRMEAIFSRATEAYEVLRDPERKLDYDRSLYAVRGIPRPSSLPHPPPPPSKPFNRAPSALELAAAVRLMSQIKRPPGLAGAPPAGAARPPDPAPAPAVGVPAPAPSGKPRYRIVVAEDDETLRKMVIRVLTEIGDCEGAADGALALAMVQAGPMPALVVTDVMMPNMDGLELARRLKKDPKTSRIPIVMLTAKSGPRDMIDGVNAGARYYVQKPFKVDELKSRVKKALGLA